jgi:hypothetical protein
VEEAPTKVVEEVQVASSIKTQPRQFQEIGMKSKLALGDSGPEISVLLPEQQMGATVNLALLLQLEVEQVAQPTRTIRHGMPGWMEARVEEVPVKIAREKQDSGFLVRETMGRVAGNWLVLAAAVLGRRLQI